MFAKQILVGCLVTASLVMGASQTKAQRAAEAKRILALLEKTGTVAIRCNAGKGSLTIKKGVNSEDKTGIVIESDTFSYGTNEIWEIRTSDTLLVNWGEEANYHLTVPNFAWNLFQEDSASKPKFDPEARAIGSVISESETVEKVECRVLDKE